MTIEDDIKNNGLTSQIVQRIADLEDFRRKHETVGHSLTPISGWVPYPATWTRTSASTFTVIGDQTAIFQGGTKLRFAQSATKYAVVRSSSYSAGTGLTTVTIHVNTNYTLAAAAITSPFFSYIENPQGWAAVEWFDWSPTYSASGAMTFTGVATAFAQYKVMGDTIDYQVRGTGTTGGVASTAIQVSTPTATMNIGANTVQYALIVDTTTELSQALIIVASSLLSFQKNAGGAWGLGANRTVIGSGRYRYS